jgi:peptidoglycan-associated lipoprotein
MSTPGKGEITSREAKRIEFTVLVYNFDIDDSTMKPGHTKWLDDVVTLATTNRQTKLRLRGSASKSGEKENNDALSEKRARAIATYLMTNVVKDKAVSPTQFAEVKGYGSDLSKSSQQEDERDRAVYVIVTAPLTIEEISFWNDGWTRPLDWDDIIGMDERNTSSNGSMGTPLRNVNIRVKASGAPMSLMPKTLPVELSSAVPGKEKPGKTTLIKPYKLDVDLNMWTGDKAPYSYEASIPITTVGPFHSAGPSQGLEVALVVRPDDADVGPADSDWFFRTYIGNAAFRGRAVQAKNPGAGSETKQVPDAKRLFLAGGVEVLTASVPAGTGLVLKNKPMSLSRLVRSPADVFYYSGHGMVKEGCLGILCDGCPGTRHIGHHDFLCWLFPAELQAYWKAPFDVSILVMSGCSVLDPDKKGSEWAKLMKQRGGPLDILLAYESEALSDQDGGSQIARQIAKNIAQGMSGEPLVRAWLDLNAERNNFAAAAFNSQGRWYLDPSTKSKLYHKLPFTGDQIAYDIIGPVGLP